MDKTGGNWILTQLKTTLSVCLNEVSVFPQRVNCMEGAKNGQGPTPAVHFREVHVRRHQLLVSVLERCPSYRDVRQERLDCAMRNFEICAVMTNAGSLKIAQNITSEAVHLCGYTCELYGLLVLLPQYSSYVRWYFRQV